MLLIQRHVLDASTRPVEEQVRLRVERRMFLKRRWRATAEDGLEFGFDLAGRLHSGAVIYQTEAVDYVMIQEDPPGGCRAGGLDRMEDWKFAFPGGDRGGLGAGDAGSGSDAAL